MFSGDEVVYSLVWGEIFARDFSSSYECISINCLQRRTGR
ncbi:unnamed protein product [Acidithrix sp. C25]|nr:unnamed protein product [Acidithrix sp. C25]